MSCRRELAGYQAELDGLPADPTARREWLIWYTQRVRPRMAKVEARLNTAPSP